MIDTKDLPHKLSFDAHTDTTELKAPRPRYYLLPFRPMESQELPPELSLEEGSLSMEFQEKMSLCEPDSPCVIRKRSLDMNYSIIGFITRKISEKSRQRIMSEEINLHH